MSKPLIASQHVHGHMCVVTISGRFGWQVSFAVVVVAIALWSDQHSKRRPCEVKRVNYEVALGWRHPPLKPVILAGFLANQAEFANATRHGALIAKYGQQVVQLTSSNSYSQHEFSTSLANYLTQTPNGFSNESMYLFGPQAWLEEPYILPGCGGAWCAPHVVTESFGLGLAGSGVSFHAHGSGFAEVVHGRKRWLFYQDPPPAFDPDVSTNKFVNSVLPTLGKPPDLDCVLGPTELLFFPKDWWHATLNLDEYNVFVSTFVSDELHDAPSMSLSDANSNSAR